VSGRCASWIAFAALLGLVSLSIILASALPQLALTEGTPFDGRVAARTLEDESANTRSGGPRPFVTFLAYAPTAIVLIAAGLYAWSMRKRGTDEEGGPPVRRTRWGTVVVMLMIVPVVFLATRSMNRSSDEMTAEAVEEEQVAEEESVVAELAGAVVTGVGDTPEAESHAASRLLETVLVTLVIGTSAAVLIAVWRLRRVRPRAAEAQPAALEQPADNALRGLAQGRDPVGVVIECYREMMSSFAATSGVDPRALTPREFAKSLESAGLGGEPLEELTSLFELVRYGHRPDDALAPRALSCMMRLRECLAEATVTS
jgi:uncharacterized membrane protein YidH (DUF202 family)